MKTSPKKGQRREEISEEAVAHYLQRHSEFFTHHEELLAQIEIPHIRGNAVSLIERKLAVLREENVQLQRQLAELIAIAQENEQLNQKIQRLIVALVSVNGLEEFFQTLYTQLNNEFRTDAVVIRWFEVPHSGVIERPEFVEYDAQVFTLFEILLESKQPICGQLLKEQVDYLFPSLTNPIASAVLIPLGIPKPQGLLAMGSHDASRFHSAMATDLLQYLGDIISHLLKMWLRNA
jgi:uncharacterized protein YigA (DUF484 family)